MRISETPQLHKRASSADDSATVTDLVRSLHLDIEVPSDSDSFDHSLPSPGSEISPLCTPTSDIVPHTPSENKHSLLNVKHQRIAEQLTLLMHCAYVDIFMCEEPNEPSMAAYTQLFNGTVKWVQFSILGQPSTKLRAKIIKKWIKVLSVMLSLRNYHGFMAVHCALRSNCVFNLKTAWSRHKRIIKKKHFRCLRRYDRIVSFKDNFCELRKHMAQATEGVQDTPILPYWGLFQRDCVFAREFAKGEHTVRELSQRYCAYGMGEYREVCEDAMLQQWIGLQMNDTAQLGEGDLNRMAENICKLDRPTHRRRHTFRSRIK